MSPDVDGARRLKAIMFTDIKGYSSLMGTDEALAVKLVLEHREIVRQCLQRHDGTEHETIGDAFVVLFDSVVNAVRCAAEIQQQLAQRNSKLPANEQVWLRIGIHLGDIIVQGDGIYGDGVNVAARVQDKADPGGISITEQVYLQIDGKVDYAFEPVGKVELKNIRNPPSLYKLHLDAKTLPRKKKRPLVVAMFAVVVMGAVAAWWALQPPVAPPQIAPAPAQPAPAQPALAQPAPPPPQAAPAAPMADDAKVQAGRKVAEAMTKHGPARVELLRQALSLDPDNASVQSMLAAAVAQAPAVEAAAATPVAAPVLDKPAAKSAPIKVKTPGHGDEGETRIKRALVVE